MQYFAGPDIRTNKLRIGDVIVNEDNVPVDSLILDRGYMIPHFDRTEITFEVTKGNSFGQEGTVYLTKEEITLMYEYMKKKENG